MLTFFMQTVTISQQLLQTQDIHQVQVGRKKWVCYIKPVSWKLCETRCLPPRGAQSSQVNILNHSRACQTAVARCLLRSCNVSGAPGHSKVTPSPPGPPQERNWNASQQQRRFTGKTFPWVKLTSKDGKHLAAEVYCVHYQPTLLLVGPSFSCSANIVGALQTAPLG